MASTTPSATAPEGLTRATSRVTVLAVNHPPVAIDDSLTAPEDTPTTIDAAANDTDLDGGALSVSAVGAAAHGATSITTSGLVRYAPASNFNGSDGFDYTVVDGAGATDTGHVTVTVTPGNDPPVAVADSVTTPEDTAITFAPAANDTDIDGDSLAVTAVGSPAAGSAVLNANGTVTYTPLADVNGTDAFDYTVGDGAGGSATGTITVTISPVNDPPSAAAKTVTTNYQTAASITLTGADTETCDLAFTIVSQPAHGKLGSIGNKLCVTLLPPYSDGATVTYTPNTGYSGPDSFTYRTSDGQLTSSPATVSITVKPAIALHIGDLDGSRTLQSTNWTAKVVLRVDNASHAAVSGVTVTGSWSAGGTASCKTASNGTCSDLEGQAPQLDDQRHVHGHGHDVPDGRLRARGEPRPGRGQQRHGDRGHPLKGRPPRRRATGRPWAPEASARARPGSPARPRPARS